MTYRAWFVKHEVIFVSCQSSVVPASHEQQTTNNTQLLTQNRLL